MKVLLIEHKLQVARDISFCLQVRYPETFIVSVAKGQRGVDMVETEAPDLVMVDSSLPDINSLDLISKIREFSDVPLIILSEAGTDIDRAKVLEAGADEYVIKPFSPIEFRLASCLILNKGRLLRYRQLAAEVWGGKTVTIGTLHFYMRRLRQKLANGNISMVRGVGYCFSDAGKYSSRQVARR